MENSFIVTGLGQTQKRVMLGIINSKGNAYDFVQVMQKIYSKIEVNGERVTEERIEPKRTTVLGFR